MTSETVRITLVADSSAVHVDSDHLDGQRRVLACSGAHLAQLRAAYERRPFVESELWAGKIERALRQHRCWLSGRRLRRATGLDAWQIRQALDWRAARPASRPSRAQTPEPAPEPAWRARSTGRAAVPPPAAGSLDRS